MEEWRDIPGFTGYQISSEGRVKSMRYGGWGGERILKPSPDRYGYLRIDMMLNGKAKHRCIHRLVALAFIPNPENKPTVDHINRDKIDNSLSNLRWATDSEQSNNKHHTLPSTGHRYIGLMRDAYKIHIPRLKIQKRFRTLEDAIAYRDSLELGAEV